VSDPFIGEIRLVPFNFAPRGWALCDGALLSIAQNQALFSLLGIAYGGDGVQTFGLPDLRGRTPMGAGPGVAMGQKLGEAVHTLIPAETPQHVHLMAAASDPGTLDTVAADQWLAGITDGKGFGYAAAPTNPAQLTTLNPANITSSGQGLPHENRQPYLCVTYAIATSGIFPPRN
jgi:microcystin-dependent protein